MPHKLAVWRHGSHRRLLQLLASREFVTVDGAQRALQLSNHFTLHMLAQLEQLRLVHHAAGRYTLRPKGRKFLDRSLANAGTAATV